LASLIEQRKVCNLCLKEKPLSQFYSKQGKCKECCKIASKEWNLNNKEKRRSIHKKWSDRNRDYIRKTTRAAQLKSLYGITVSKYNELLSLQNGVCAICQTPPNMNGRTNTNLHVDHNHKTGSLRGLLCSRCNLSIGKFEDNPLLLRAAADYLENYGIID
jgi:hypothetical protein